MDAALEEEVLFALKNQAVVMGDIWKLLGEKCLPRDKLEMDLRNLVRLARKIEQAREDAARNRQRGYT